MSDDHAQARAHERVGDVLNDKWTLERLLGVGGMGAVYAGLHRNGARAAVKVLHRYLASHEDVRKRFLREGYAANRVEHPAVVKVLDDDTVAGGADDGTAYLVMELLEGESLEGRSRRGVAVSERDFLGIADIVLDALSVAHANGVVHRDIKPDNIFLAHDADGRERVKILDFGLARLLEGQSTTVHGLALGTPSFMAPEQAAGRNNEIDGRTDLFALAATGFRLVTGRRVHEGVNSVDLVARMATLPAPRVRTVAPQLSEPFARVLDRALEFKREQRYESAEEMRADVRIAIDALDTPATSAATSCPTTLPSAGAAALDVPAAPTVREQSVELSASNLEPADMSAVPAEEPRLPVAADPTPAAVAPRRYTVPAVSAIAVVCIGAGAAYAAGWLAPSPPFESSPVSSGQPASSAPLATGASPTDVDGSDASGKPDGDATAATATAKDASVARPRRAPSARPIGPWKPLRRPKR